MPFDFKDELDETLYENFYDQMYGSKEDVQASSKRIKELTEGKEPIRKDKKVHGENT